MADDAKEPIAERLAGGPAPDWVSGCGTVVLYQGDCLRILPELPDGCVDAVVTDPPYGHNNNNNGDLIHKWEAALGRLRVGDPSPQARPIANDGVEANELFREVLAQWNRLLAAGGCCCCCGGGGGPDPQFARWSLWLDEVFDFKQMVVWDKGPMGMGWHYRRSYETVLVAQKKGCPCRWFAKSKRVENVIRPGGRIKKIIPSADDHPTPKPVELAEHFVRLHTAEGHTVLDSFMGAGWVGVACARLNRQFIGLEISSGYFAMAVKRIEGELNRHPLFEPPPERQQAMFAQGE